MKTLKLKSIDPVADCDFLNDCNVELDIIPKNDFGSWYDYPTGSLILSPSDSVIFKVENPEDEIALILKFGDRISEVKS